MTTLLQHGSAEEIPRFELNLDRVTISHRSIDSASCCVKSYVRNPLFTQWDFFTENGISMLLSAVNIARNVCKDSLYNPWTRILPGGYDVVLRDLEKAYDVVVVRRKSAQDTSERCFGVASVKFPVIGDSSGQQGVRISNIVKNGVVEYLPESVTAPQIPSTGSSAKSPAKVKPKKSETPAALAINRLFEFDDESVVLPMGQGVYFDDPNFAMALKDQDKTSSSRRSGHSRRTAPVFQSNPR